MEDHFDRAPDLEQTLEAKGDIARWARPVRLGTRTYSLCPQGEPKGLGHAMFCGLQQVGDQPFAALLGDGLFDERDELLTTLMDVQAKPGGSVVAVFGFEPTRMSAYGCAGISAIHGEGFVRVNSLVEKPRVEDAPSNLAVAEKSS